MCFWMHLWHGFCPLSSSSTLRACPTHAVYSGLPLQQILPFPSTPYVKCDIFGACSQDLVLYVRIVHRGVFDLLSFGMSTVFFGLKLLLVFLPSYSRMVCVNSEIQMLILKVSLIQARK